MVVMRNEVAMEIILGTDKGNETLESEVKYLNDIKVIFTKDEFGCTRVYLPINDYFIEEESIN